MSTISPPPRTPGARGRIGIIQPAPGVMLEHEWPAWLPADVLFPVARMRMPGATRAAYAAMAAAAPEPARDLASAGASLVAYACTVGSVFAGVEAERALVESLAAASGKPAISLGEASAAALRAVGAKRLVVLTPYGAETNRWVTDYLEACGFAIEAVAPTPVDIVTVGDLAPATIAAVGIAALERHPGAGGLWIPCTAIQTLNAVDAIEAVSGVPVVSGSQALLWRALNLLGVRRETPGPGSLFAPA